MILTVNRWSCLMSAVLQFRTIRNSTVAINDQWLLLKPELLWFNSQCSSSTVNELSALRNTFYPEYKYLSFYNLYNIISWCTQCSHQASLDRCFCMRPFWRSRNAFDEICYLGAKPNSGESPRKSQLRFQFQAIHVTKYAYQWRPLNNRPRNPQYGKAFQGNIELFAILVSEIIFNEVLRKPNSSKAALYGRRKSEY